MNSEGAGPIATAPAESGQATGPGVVAKLALLAWMFGSLFVSWLAAAATLPGWSRIVAQAPPLRWGHELLLRFFYAPVGS